MFGGGWAEMFVIGIVALVVIGPKDLPVVMRKIGRVVGTVRRMGGEFQRELNKTTGLDQIADLRRSITEPLRQSSEDIMKEFNRQTSSGVEPSGAIKPADPKVESVYETIAATSGVPAADAGVPPPVMKPLAASEPLPAPVEAAVLPATSSKPRKPAKAAAIGKPTAAPKRAAARAVSVDVAAEKPRASRKPAAAKIASASQPGTAAAPVPEVIPATPEAGAAPSRRKPAAKPAPVPAAAAKPAPSRARAKKA